MFDKRTRSVVDPGHALIDAWLKAFTTFNEERLRAWPDDDLLDAERAKIAALATAIRERMTSDYLSRRHP